jgi:hypothetical protein
MNTADGLSAFEKAKQIDDQQMGGQHFLVGKVGMRSRFNEFPFYA